MSLFKKNKKGSALGAPKGKRKKRPRPANAGMPPNTAPSTDDINNSLPTQQQADGAVPPSASVSLDDLQKAKPNARKPRAKKRKKRPSGNKPSFLDKLGLGKKKKQPSNLPPMENAEGQPKPARPKKKPKAKVSFLDKLGLGKKKKPVSQAPSIAKPEGNPVVNTEGQTSAPTGLPALDNTPTSSVEEVLKAKTKPNPKGRKKAIKRGAKGGKKDKKSLKVLVGLVFGIVGLALAVLLLLPLLSDAENGNLKGTVTGGNIENQQPVENTATEQTAENNQQNEKSTPPAENKAKPVQAQQTAQPQQPAQQKMAEPVKKPVVNNSKKSAERLMKSNSNSNQKITLNEDDFLELSESTIYRDE